MAEQSSRVQIAVAIIGLVGLLGVAAISNWEKLFPPRDLDRRQRENSIPQTTQTPVTNVTEPGTTGSGGDPTPPLNAVSKVQDEWRFCFRRHSMFYDGYPTKGTCPAGGGHAAAGYIFLLPYDHPNHLGGQPDWRFCDRCFSMFWAGDPANQGRCPAGGSHNKQGFFFFLPHDHSGPGQDEWRFCDKCRVMFWNGETNKGICPAGGSHKAQGFNFKLDFKPS